MNSTSPQDLSPKKAIRAVKKTVKEILTRQGIEASTRKGNKELDILLKKLVKGNSVNVEDLKQLGETLGQSIVSVSEQRGVKHLDKQVIAHIALKNDMPVLTSAPVAAAPKIVSKAVPVSIARTPIVQKEIEEESQKSLPLMPKPEEEPLVAESEEEEEEVVAESEEEEEEVVAESEEEEEEVVAESEEEEEEEVVAESEEEEEDELVAESEEEEEDELVAESEEEEEDELVAESEEEEEDELVAESEEEEEDELVAESEEEEEDELVAESEEEEEDELVAESEEEEEEEDELVAESEEEEEEEDELVAESEEEEEDELVAESEEEEELVEEKKSNSFTSLKDRITEDIKLAMKAQDKIRLETVRGIKKAVIEKEVSVRPQGQETLTPEQEIEVLSQQAKQRRDSIEQFQKANRDDLADKEAQELAIIETYLPQQLSEDELQEILDEIIVSVAATSVKDLGKVMGIAMQKLKGKADGKKIQEMVKNKLQ